MPAGLTIITEQNNGIHHVTLGGYLDGHTAMQLERELETFFASGGSRLVFDLSGLSYIASAGVGVLIGAQHIAKKHGGGLSLLNPSVSVREIFSILGLDAILPIHASRNDAEASVLHPPAVLPTEA